MTSARRLPVKKTAGLFIGLVIVTALAAVVWRSQPAHHPTSDLSVTPTLASLTEAAKTPKVTPLGEALHRKDWVEVRRLLQGSMSAEDFLPQILRWADSVPQTELADLHALVLETWKAKPDNARARVLYVRFFSKFNHTPKQFADVRKQIESSGKISVPELTVLAGESTVPFPASAARILSQQLKSRDAAQVREAIYSVTRLQDEKLRTQLQLEAMRGLAKAPSAVQPYVAKVILESVPAEIREKKDYGLFVKYVSRQNSDIWREVQKSIR